MTLLHASKKEAQDALNKARVKAQAADADAVKLYGTVAAYDAARLHYDRCVRELEECINEMANWESRDEPSED